MSTTQVEEMLAQAIQPLEQVEAELATKIEEARAHLELLKTEHRRVQSVLRAAKSVPGTPGPRGASQNGGTRTTRSSIVSEQSIAAVRQVIAESETPLSVSDIWPLVGKSDSHVAQAVKQLRARNEIRLVGRKEGRGNARLYAIA